MPASDCHRVRASVLAEPLDVGWMRCGWDAWPSPGVGRRCDALGCGLEAFGECAEHVGEAWADSQCPVWIPRLAGVERAKGVEVEVLIEVPVALGLFEMGEVEERVGVVQEHGCLRKEWGSGARLAVAALDGRG